MERWMMLAAIIWLACGEVVVGAAVRSWRHPRRFGPGVADQVLWFEDGAFREFDALAVDPVCGMAVDRAMSWFCSTACRDEFAANPERFAARLAEATASIAGTEKAEAAHDVRQ